MSTRYLTQITRKTILLVAPISDVISGNNSTNFFKVHQAKNCILFVTAYVDGFQGEKNLHENETKNIEYLFRERMTVVV